MVGSSGGEQIRHKSDSDDDGHHFDGDGGYDNDDVTMMVVLVLVVISMIMVVVTMMIILGHDWSPWFVDLVSPSKGVVGDHHRDRGCKDLADDR